MSTTDPTTPSIPATVTTVPLSTPRPAGYQYKTQAGDSRRDPRMGRAMVRYLLGVNQYGPIGARPLAELLGVKPATHEAAIARPIRALSDRGLIASIPDPRRKDGSWRLWSVTPAGRLELIRRGELDADAPAQKLVTPPA